MDVLHDFCAHLFVCVLFCYFVCLKENDIHPHWECRVANSLDLFEESTRQSLRNSSPKKVFPELVLRNTLTFDFFYRAKRLRK